VQSVPAPPLVARPGRRALVAALLASAAVFAATASTSDTHAPAPRPHAASRAYDGLIGGVALQSARCVQWNAGTSAERDKVAGALAYSVGGATPYGPGTTLSSGEAHSLFDRACARPIAQHWLLYELYIRAAGFHSYQQR
jgi:hypothetical protein